MIWGSGLLLKLLLQPLLLLRDCAVFMLRL